MVDFLSVMLVCGLSAAYILRILLFDEQAAGPFESKQAFLQLSDGQVARGINLFDRLRRLFGAYRVTEVEELKIWSVWEPRMQVWACPICLSFYCSAPFTLVAVEKGVANSLLDGVLFYLAVTFVAQFLVFLQLCLEGE
jgi:hypothetical protein